MKGMHRVLVVAALACAVGVIFLMKREGAQQDSEPETVPARATVTVTNEATVVQEEAPKDEALPRLLELGSTTCVPCKMMKPVLEGLRREFGDRLRVEFIDVKAAPGAAAPYGISVIPTQIWFDASGEELTRHEGFIPKEDILAVFGEHGIDVGGAASTLPEIAREEPLAQDARAPDARSRVRSSCDVISCTPIVSCSLHALR